MTLTSPKARARIAGGLYVLIILLGGFAEVGGRQGMVVAGDPIATANAILAHEAMFRWGFMAEVVTNLIAIPATLIIYDLLKPVSRTWTLMAVVFDLTQNAVNAVNACTQFAPLNLLASGPTTAALPFAERAALARLSLQQHDVGFNVALGFFGVALVIYGGLIVRSTFLPRLVGALYGLAGLAYLANGFLYFLDVGAGLGGPLLLVCLVGEAAFALWLLVVGVDEVKWRRVAMT